MKYIIRGTYPSYAIWDGDNLLDHISDFRTVMLWFVSRLNEGDQIVWQAS